MGCGAMSLNRRSGYADSYEPHRAAIRLLKGPHSSPFVQRSTEGARGSPATDQTRPGLTGADDGIRTRVNGFAGRCLATQPHPHCPARCHPGGINQSVSLTVISSPPGKVGTMQMWLAARVPRGRSDHHAARCRARTDRHTRGAKPRMMTKFQQLDDDDTE